MSPLDVDLGVDLSIADEAPSVNNAGQVDAGFLLMPFVGTAPAAPVEIKSPAAFKALYPSEALIQAAVDGYFGVGGGRMFVGHLGAVIATSLAGFTPQMGAGQLIAPTITVAADINTLSAWAWANNRVYIAQAADGILDAALITLSAATINASSRNTMLEGDFLKIPGATSGTTRDVAASVISAGLIARSDRVTGNPNLAAAGNHTPGASGVASPYVVGIKTERPAASQKTLAQSQVNSYRTVNGQIRKYGYFTLADLTTLPQWWDFGGSRLAMALRAEEQAAAEELLFGQVAADGLFQDKYKGALAGVLARYQRLGAIYGTAENPGYSVNVGAVVNPIANLARGEITAVILFRSSPFAAELKLTLTRRAITDQVVA